LGKCNVTLDRSCGRPLGRWSTACGEIPTSGPLETVLGGVRGNLGVIPIKSAHPRGGSGAHLIHSFSGPPKSTNQTAFRSVQPFMQGSGSLQTDRPTNRPRFSVCSNGPHLASAAIWPKSGANSRRSRVVKQYNLVLVSGR